MLYQPNRSTKRVQLDNIHETIRNRICLRTYPPGAVLREGELATEFGVSRTPIREVLQRLAFAGLVEPKNGVGSIVVMLDYPTILDIYEMRLKVSELIGILSPRPVAPATIERLDDLEVDLTVLRRDFEMERYWKVNHQVHSLIAEIIGNRALRDVWDHLYFRIAPTWYEVATANSQQVAQSLAREVGDVRTALEEEDVIALGLLQRNYIAYGLRLVKAFFEARSLLAC